MTYNTVFIGDGLYYVPISGDAGYWRTIIMLESGAEYVGVFML